MRPLVPVVLLVLLTPPALALPPPSSLQAARLIEQLGSPGFAEREAAHKKLEALGERALPALQKAAKDAKDAEVRRRAGRLVQAADDRSRSEEVKKFAGAWDATYLEAEGKPVPAEEYAAT